MSNDGGERFHDHKISSPKRANQGSKEGQQYDAVLQKIQRDQIYEQISPNPEQLEQGTNPKMSEHNAPKLDEFEEWSYRRRAQAGSHAANPCFVTERIRTRGGLQHPVKKITFRIVTRDQGFTLSSAIESKWWHSVGVIPVSQESTSLSPEEEEKTDEFFNDDDNSAARNMIRVQYLSTNQYARYDGDDNTFVWTADSWNKVQAGWVQELKVGERIVVKPYGNFKGWQSRIDSISVTVHNQLAL